ncbi:MAG: hypothetical protein K2O08_02355 [Clostridia bacterium]|nr:hypothetical protein [Clostridia bacterium]
MMKNINISGNFNTAERELEVVKLLLEKNGVKYANVEKCENADDGDVVVNAYGKIVIIEVKEEDYLTRFLKYSQVGIDFLSVFTFKPNTESDIKHGVKRPNMYEKLRSSIDMSKHFKRGKLFYSKSHLWLFYSQYNDEFKYAEFFDGEGIKSDEFRNYLFKECMFAVNNKPSEQLSFNDGYQSAVIYVDSNDAQLNKYRVDDLKAFIEKIQ